jgi:hypothetical protein
VVVRVPGTRKHVLPLNLHTTTRRLLLLASLALVVRIGSLRAADAGYQIIERSQDSAILRNISTTTDAAGNTTSRTNQFTLLENCLNYLEDGQWKESADVVEPFPDGAIARRGPNKAIFSSDLNSEVVFEVQTSDGKRLRGGVRLIQLTDIATGKSAILATVKSSAPGKLMPPNTVVYADAFDGLKADVLIDWKHNSFSQDVVLREQPTLPPGMSPDTTRLEVITEFVEFPQPTIRKQTFEAGSGSGQLEDDVVIHFGRLAMVMGKAFPVQNDVAWAVGGLNASEGSLPVLKQWHTLPDGRVFLIESIGWTDAQPHLKGLPAASQVRVTPASKDKTAVARVWPERPKPLADVKPVEVARVSYQPQGYVVDFVIIPDEGTPTTLASGQTYYIKTSYYSGSSVTFQPGCTIKFKNNAYMLLYGPISFPGTGDTPVFTSRNDDFYGEKIQGVTGESDSNGDPTLHKAAQAIWIYYVNFGTTIQNTRIRWANTAVQYDANNYLLTHTFRDSRLERCDTGIYANNCSVSIINVTKCGVQTPTAPPAWMYFSGTMTEDCGGDTDLDCLDDDRELENFGNLNQNCFGDPDSDGLDNGEEFLWGGDPLASDNGWPATLNIGLVLSGEQTINFSPNPGFPDNSGIGFDANKGNTADSIVVTEPVQGQLLIRWNSTFIEGLAGSDPPISDYVPTPAEKRLMGEAFGDATSTTLGRISQVNQAKVDQFSEQLLDHVVKETSGHMRNHFRLIQMANTGEYVPGIPLDRFMQAKIDAIHTSWTRLRTANDSLVRRFGRAANRFLPVVGGILIFASGSSYAEQFVNAAQDYANDIQNGNDESGSAAILSGLCNDLAPGSGNTVLNYLLR